MGRKLYTEDDHYSTKEDRSMIFKAKLMWLVGLPGGLLLMWLVVIPFLTAMSKGCNEWVDGIVEDTTPPEFTPTISDGTGSEKTLLEQFSSAPWEIVRDKEMDDYLTLVRPRSSDSQVVLYYRYSIEDDFTKDYYLLELEFTLTKQTPDKIEVQFTMNNLSRFKDHPLHGDYPDKKYFYLWRGTGTRGKLDEDGRLAWKIDYERKDMARNTGGVPSIFGSRGTLFLVQAP